jgi:hypothetical protein
VNILLWIIQIILALMVFAHGRRMLFPPASLQAGMAYIMAIPAGFRRLIGAAEILAGIGLVLPSLTGILPWLTPLAASGLIILMVGSIIFHVIRKEFPNIVLNLIILAGAIFIAYGRFIAFPI